MWVFSKKNLLFCQFCCDLIKLAQLETKFFTDFGVDFIGHVSVVAEIFKHSFSALTDLFIVVAEPASALLDDALFNSNVNHTAKGGDACAVKDVKLCNFERRCNFVFDNLCFDVVANNFGAVLEGVCLADVNAD